MSKSRPTSVKSLDDFGRIQLSETFYMREFLYSEIAAIHRMQNIPDNPDMAIRAGSELCQQLLEPLQKKFGRIAVRSGFRARTVNRFGNDQQKAGKGGYSCASNEVSYTHHIWDELDQDGYMGASASIVVPSFAKLYSKGMCWTCLAWWIHDHLPYSTLYFFPKNAAFNIQWHEKPLRKIQSYIAPKGTLTKQGMDNHDGDHSAFYQDLLRKL